MTKLEAVNEMLLAIGQAPVNTLSVTGVRDVSIASTLLDNVSREVQSDGHKFNTNTITLALDENSQLPIPADALQVDPTDLYLEAVPAVEPESGTLKLYDQLNETFTWDEPIEVSVVRLLPYESLPQHARRFILAKAKLRFQASTVGSDTLNKLFETEMGEAYAAFRKAELLQADHNILTANSGLISRNRFRAYR